MSNQRSGKWKPAAMSDGNNDMKLRNFFRTAAKVVEEDTDAQFFFEQIVEHINGGGNLLTDDPVAIRRILGAQSPLGALPFEYACAPKNAATKPAIATK